MAKYKIDFKKFSSKVAKPLCGSEKGFTLLELLITISILGILAGLIVPNVTSFVGKGNVSAANAELAEVGVAAQAAAGATASGFITPQILDQAALTSVNNIFAPYITGKLQGAYWINANGTVDMVDQVEVTNPFGGAVAGDPSYPDLYFNETTAQFQSSPTTPIGTHIVGPGTNPSP